MHPTRTLPGKLSYLRGAHYPHSTDAAPGHRFCFCCPSCLLVFGVSESLSGVGPWGKGGRQGAGCRLFSCPRGGRAPVAWRWGCADWGEAAPWRAGSQGSLPSSDTYQNVAGAPFARPLLTLRFAPLHRSAGVCSSCGDLYPPSAGGRQRDRHPAEVHFFQLCPRGRCSHGDLEFPSPRRGAGTVCKSIAVVF